MRVVHKLRLVLLGVVIAASVVGAPAVAQQPQKPNVVFILADNVGTVIWVRMAVESCGARQRHASTKWPARGCD
jgi:hypothetical protein